MPTTTSYEKSGYLTEDFHIFHLKDINGQNFEYHYHDFDKILIYLSGRVTYRIEGRSYHLAPYDVVFVRHNNIHRPEVDFSVPYERIIAYISPGFLKVHGEAENDLSRCFTKMQEYGSDVYRLSPAHDTKIMTTITALTGSLHDTGYACRLYSRLVFLEFMVCLNRTVLESPSVYLTSGGSHPRIQEILLYINGHLESVLSVDSLAERFYFSRYHLMRTFKKETGYTLAGYIQEKRLLAARERIAAGIPSMQAAMECGFQDYSAFAKAFKRKFQASPAQFAPDYCHPPKAVDGSKMFKK